MDRMLRAILRTELAFFIRKVFATISPGETYLHNWHLNADRPSVDAGPRGRGPAAVDQPAASLAQIDLRLGCVCRLAARPRSDPPRDRGKLFGRLRRRTPPTVSDGGQLRVVCGALSHPAVGEGNRPRAHHDSRGEPIRDLSWGNAQRARRRSDHRRRSPQRQRGPFGAGQEARDNWYGGALVSRLIDKQTGSIVAVMQRLHEDDLAGHLLRQGGWDHLDMPALALENEIIEWRQWVLAV